MRILLVEDEIKLANATKRALQLQKYAVDVAYSGTDGLDLAIGESFDVIILDVMLPGVDGIEICIRIRKAKITTPVLLLTAKGEIYDKVIGLDSGGDDYLVKPFSLEELFARVRALTRRPEQINDTLLRAKDLTLDSRTLKVKRRGVEILLSTREFSLLQYLLRNKNKVVTREQIVSHLWNYESDVLPATVEVHLKHVRDKIDAPFSEKLIFTVRGFGYELKE
jgi:DNA-binding response OmpR family regulator